MRPILTSCAIRMSLSVNESSMMMADFEIPKTKKFLGINACDPGHEASILLRLAKYHDEMAAIA